jgi:aminobenzoyl-glutamate transport protein
MTTATAPEPAGASLTQRLLDGVERVGNKVPHPALMFLYLIIGVIVLSAVLAWLDVSVTEQVAVPVPIGVPPSYYEDSVLPILAPAPADIGYLYADDFEIVEQTIAIESLLTVEGIRFIFTSFVPNFAGFSVVAVVLVAMMGAGVAEAAGLMGALIRLLVKVSPRRLLAFILIFVGVLSSVATDAGYLILVPLGAAAFISVGRSPLAGLAAAFAGVGAIFGVNLIPTPSDAMITEITNESIALAGGEPISILSNYYFAIVASIVLAVVAAVVTERVVEPRLRAMGHAGNEAAATSTGSAGDDPAEDEHDGAPDPDAAAKESRGLRYAGLALLGFAILIGLLTLPPGAPLRDPVSGDIVGQTPFMDSLIFIISLLFLVCGIGYGVGARTFTSGNDVVAAITKTFASLAGLIFMLLMISQFIAVFNYSNLPSVLAVSLAELLEQAGIGALPLMLGMILVITLLDFIMPGLVPKWAIFAPIFVPLFMQLDVAPQTVLAAYRVGDSPVNVITPLMVYLPFMVTIAQRYQKGAGIGTVIALMLPYTIVILAAWIVLYVAWFILGIPWGPGYPVGA